MTVNIIKNLTDTAESDEETEIKNTDDKSNALDSSNPIHLNAKHESSRTSSSSSTSSRANHNSSSRKITQQEVEMANTNSKSRDSEVIGRRSTTTESKQRVTKNPHSEGFVRRMTRRSVLFTQSLLSRLTTHETKKHEENEKDVESSNDQGGMDDLEAGGSVMEDDSSDDDDTEFRGSLSNRPVVSTADITMARENSLVEPGMWRQRVLQEEKERKEKKSRELKKQKTKKLIKKVVKSSNTVKNVKKEKKKDKLVCMTYYYTTIVYSPYIGGSICNCISIANERPILIAQESI